MEIPDDILQYDQFAYHCCICEKKNGKFIMFLDLEGIKGFLSVIDSAVYEFGSYGKEYLRSYNDKHFVCSGQKLLFCHAYIIGRAYPKSPIAGLFERASNRSVKLYLTHQEADELLERVYKFYRHVLRSQAPQTLELYPGLSIAYVPVWPD